MTDWKAIEKLDVDNPVWVITYVYWGQTDEMNKPDYAGPWAEVHGWYETEADAWKVQAHFPKPNSYRVHKAHKRVML